MQTSAKENRVLQDPRPLPDINQTIAGMCPIEQQVFLHEMAKRLATQENALEFYKEKLPAEQYELLSDLVRVSEIEPYEDVLPPEDYELLFSLIFLSSES
jgi:hypothetical protein